MPRRRWAGIVVAVPLVAATAVAAGLAPGTAPHPRRTASRTIGQTLQGQGRTPATAGVRMVRLGRSRLGRPIVAAVVGQSRRRRADLLVVGCIHGNEPAGRAVTRLLRRTLARQPVDAWLVDDLNPDGRHAGTRGNARGVDLNRNFPWHWTPLGPPGSPQYAGPHPLSEPESEIVHRLILRIRPRIAIWFHQPLATVDESGGRLAIERRFSRLSGLPLKRLTRYPGSAVGWENHAIPGSSAFVVELPAGRPTPRSTLRIARAVALLGG